ncbi:hypothetical protein DXG01_007591 [Tephrocybe rancida]|nr:hypothetical protein DXG01_007591 [Tephrocybe rancida]
MEMGMPDDIDITSVAISQCQRCHEKGPGLLLKYFANKKHPQLPGLSICEKCQNHYRLKSQSQSTYAPPTQQHPGQIQVGSAIHPSSPAFNVSQHVHQQVNAAQRGEPQVVIRSLGPAQAPAGSMGPPQLLPGSQHALPAGSGPDVQSAITNPHGTYTSHQRHGVPAMPPCPGYTVAHQVYVVMKTHFQKLAYSGVGLWYMELIIVKVTLMVHDPTSKKAHDAVQNIVESVDNIPVRIGYYQLREVAFNAVLHHFLKWSHNYNLSIEDCGLRTKHGVEILPVHTPDTDVISEPFFKAKGQNKAVKTFTGKAPIDIWLTIPFEVYEAVQVRLEHIENPPPVNNLERIADAAFDKKGKGKRQEAPTMDAGTKTVPPGKKSRQSLFIVDSQSDASSSSSKKFTIKIPGRPQSKPSPAASLPSQIIEEVVDDDSGAVTPQVPPAAPATTANNALPQVLKILPKRVAASAPNAGADLLDFDIHEFRGAIIKQIPPPRRDIRSLLSATSIDCRVYMLPRHSIGYLLKNPKALMDILAMESVVATLSYGNIAPTSGTFKTAHAGVSSKPLFRNSESHAVCIKQAFFFDKTNNTNKFYDGAKQAEVLTIELNCIGWSDALFDMVYHTVDAVDQEKGMPPFEVPKMRYVQAGIAISLSESENGIKQAFLVEELIGTKGTDYFIKYINNDSARPRKFKNLERSVRAEFLAFAQHLMYVKTGATIYASDLQGNRDLLTDPQIITAVELIGPNQVFASGNVNFESFANDKHKGHLCNRYCDYYGLSPFVDLAAGAGAGDQDTGEDVPDNEEENFPSKVGQNLN